MADDANTELLDLMLQHEIFLQRYKKNQLQDLVIFLRKLTDDVSGQLGQQFGDISGSVKSTRLNGLLHSLNKISDAASQEMMTLVQSQLRDLATYESGFMVGAVKSVLPIELSLVTPAPVQVWAAVTARPFEGRLLEQWVVDYSSSQRKRIEQAVRTSVVEGETVDTAIRRIRGTSKLGGQDGIIQGVTKRSAEALVRTAINHTVTAARQESAEQNFQVLKGMQWRATLDSLTSLICISRDGTVYPLDSGPRTPGHPNCRSTMIPILKSWKEMGINLAESPPGTRASLNGQVPASETYGTWLKRQPAGFQDDVLGSARGQLFRSGKLSVDRFVDESGHTYTLAQLRQRHPAAF